MKNKIKQWLGIYTLQDDIELAQARIDSLRLRVSDLESESSIDSGTTAKEGGLKELVWHIYRFLGVSMRREFYQ